MLHASGGGAFSIRLLSKAAAGAGWVSPAGGNGACREGRIRLYPPVRQFDTDKGQASESARRNFLLFALLKKLSLVKLQVILILIKNQNISIKFI